MDATLFFAQIWGPILVAVGLGVFVSRSYYVKIYRDLENDALAALTFGMVAVAAGIFQVHAHNLWGNFSQVVISLLSWALLIKGLIFIIIPKLANRGGDWILGAKLIPAVGVATLIIGLYISWVGYM